MDPTKENIECKKGEAVKYFSQRQLDVIGQSRDGSFDGWMPTAKKPVGIPDEVLLPTDTDPNGGIVMVHAPISDDPNGIETPNGVLEPLFIDTPTAPADAANVVAPVAPETPAVDPAKVEKVEKEPTKPKAK